MERQPDGVVYRIEAESCGVGEGSERLALSVPRQDPDPFSQCDLRDPDQEHSRAGGPLDAKATRGREHHRLDRARDKRSRVDIQHRRHPMPEREDVCVVNLTRIDQGMGVEVVEADQCATEMDSVHSEPKAVSPCGTQNPEPVELSREDLLGLLSVRGVDNPEGLQRRRSVDRGRRRWCDISGHHNRSALIG